MAPARVRRAFKYPEEHSDSEVVEFLDEQGVSCLTIRCGIFEMASGLIHA